MPIRDPLSQQIIGFCYRISNTLAFRLAVPSISGRRRSRLAGWKWSLARVLGAWNSRSRTSN